MRRLCLASVLVLTGLLSGAWSAQAARWGKEYVPNVPVVTQDGKTLKFYDDLIKDKIVVLSFIYTSCKDICWPRLGSARRRTSSAIGSAAISFFIPSASSPNATRQSA